MQHAERWFDGPAFVDDKGGSLLNDFLHDGATLLWKSAFGPTVRVTVRLMGPYKRAAGITDDVTLTLTEPNLGGVLTAIIAQFPDAGKKLQPAPGKIEPAVRVIVNDVVQQGVTPALPLKDGDRVAFVPIVGGGTAGR
jgi:molybdopterin converting factor small subunit